MTRYDNGMIAFHQDRFSARWIVTEDDHAIVSSGTVYLEHSSKGILR